MVTLTLTDSHRLDTYGKDSKGHSLASALKLDRPTLRGFPRQTAPSLQPRPASDGSTPPTAPKEPHPSPTTAQHQPQPLSFPVQLCSTPPRPSPKYFSRSSTSPGLSHTLPPTLLLPPPPLSSTQLLTSWSSSLRVPLQAPGLEAPLRLTFQVPASELARS